MFNILIPSMPRKLIWSHVFIFTSRTISESFSTEQTYIASMKHLYIIPMLLPPVADITSIPWRRVCVLMDVTTASPAPWWGVCVLTIVTHEITSSSSISLVKHDTHALWYTWCCPYQWHPCTVVHLVLFISMTPIHCGTPRVVHISDTPTQVMFVDSCMLKYWRCHALYLFTWI